ncbi:amidohydrolase family protein [Kineosporia sp. J2-2]|uniref:Amidohydrolase family protein n=1 Tax=Kineosporia corallincola TaxID=2835133 RepID=A0ABS5TMW7_9ACTN|nr:amidohydrolase family protein [Kineosporia corallincola]MBT0772437.1 amidohydrolase family protein [Kineosporia corallincola]
MPDLLVTGDIHTLAPPHVMPPVVEAVGVRDGVIVNWGSPGWVRAELGGRVHEIALPGTVLPGLTDSHVHVLWAGRRRDRCDLDGVGSVQEIVRRLAAHARRQGGGWVEADLNAEAFDLAERRLPTRHDLDRACPGGHVVLDRKGHDVIVSTAVLHRAGITATTRDPEGGRIVRDPSGSPTGLLIEHPAAALVRRVVPAPDLVTRMRWIELGQRELLGLGVTTAMDPAVALPDLEAWAQAAREGRLRQRAVVMPLGGDDVTPEQVAAAAGPLAAIAPARLRVGPTKLFLDGGGSLGTAWRSVPWPGTKNDHGNQSITLDTLRAHCAAGLRGHGVGVHAVGDAAIDAVLDVLEVLNWAGDQPYRGTGFHLIHGYLTPSRSALARAARLGVALSAHPALQWSFGTSLIGRLGEDEAAGANPLRAWLDAGVLVGGGSDGPGGPMSPLFGMWQARTRMVQGRDEPLGPAQAITPRQALTMFTTGAAAITGQPGHLYPGGPADLTAVDVDPLLCDDEMLRRARVLATVVGGQVAHVDIR